MVCIYDASKAEQVSCLVQVISTENKQRALQVTVATSWLASRTRSLSKRAGGSRAVTAMRFLEFALWLSHLHTYLMIPQRKTIKTVCIQHKANGQLSIELKQIDQQNKLSISCIKFCCLSCLDIFHPFHYFHQPFPGTGWQPGWPWSFATRSFWVLIMA